MSSLLGQFSLIFMGSLPQYQPQSDGNKANSKTRNYSSQKHTANVLTVDHIVSYKANYSKYQRINNVLNTF